MIRFTALWSNDDSLNRWALSEERDALRWEAAQVARLGLGWLQDGRSLLQRYPRGSGAALDVGALLAEQRSRTLVACADEDEGVKEEMADIAPFRFRSWLYAAAPSAPLAAEERGALLEALPDFLKRNVEGSSDGEALFHHLLAELHRRDVFHMATIPGRLVAEAMASSIEGLRALAPRAVAGLQCVALTERLVVGATGAAPLAIRPWRGVEEPAPAPLFAGHRQRPVTHAHYKGWLVVSGEVPRGEQWSQIEPGHVFWIGRDGALETRPLDSL